MDDFKVSIVMPVYNGGQYFELALKSALTQTYQNIEIIIVNDGSTDGGETESIGRRYAATNSEKVRYFHQENTGVGGALNRGVQVMSGKFFCWLSHDDLYLPNKTQVQVDAWRQLNRADAMLMSDYNLIDPYGEWFADVRFDHSRFISSPMLPLYRGAVNGCTVFIPVHLLREQPGPFDPTRKFTQDFWLWRQLLQQHEFFHVPKSLVQYRVHPEQDSQRPEVVGEGETLWRLMVDDVSVVQRAQLYGSSWRFFDETHRVLATSPYKETAAYLLRNRDACLSETLVSVIIPVFNEEEVARRALASVLVQAHTRLEVILVDDGSTAPLESLKADAARDPRVRFIAQSNAGPGAARNRGLREARGEYIAFLDSDDEFYPDKISRQLQAMAAAGAVFSHTSYYVTYPGRRVGRGLLHSGRFSGDVYPKIAGGCPIATPTVMLHRSVKASGFEFPTNVMLGEDVLTWIDVAASYPVLGLDEPLTLVEWSDSSAALDLAKADSGLRHQIEALKAHQLHSRFSAPIAALERAHVAVLDKIRKGATIDEDLVMYAFNDSTL